MTTAYRGFRVVPKRDFDPHGHLIDGKWVKKGWIALDKNDCNAMPGATWFQTVEEAKHCIDVLIETKGNADEFWRRLDDEREGGPAYRVGADEKTGEVSVKLKGQTIAVMKAKGAAGKQQGEKLVKALLAASSWPKRGYVEEPFALNVIEGSQEDV